MAEKRYWKGLEEKYKAPEFQKKQSNEFPEELPVFGKLANEETEQAPSSRRDFLKMLGFSVTAATVAASCEMPVRKSIPYVSKPDEIIPGIANYYASTFMEGGDYCSVLVKTREGRPIKVEGNPASKITGGGTSARAQAAVLSLYDKKRPKGPMREGEQVSWAEADKDISEKLTAIAEEGGKIRILSSTILSPSAKKAVEDFKAKYPGTEHITSDPISYSGILRANEKTFGIKAIPDYKFEKAQVIVSFGADFLGTWVSPVEYANQYIKNRKVSKDNTRMSRHVQVESHLSLTGSNADKRVLVKPSEEGIALLHLYNVLASKSGGQTSANINELNAKAKSAISRTADELLKAKGKSLVVCGSNNENAQLITNAINQLLENYGKTIDWSHYSNQRQGDESDLKQLTGEIENGEVDALIFFDANPVYNHPDSENFTKALDKVDLKISLNEKLDETALLCDYICPKPHFLEDWNDAEAKKGQYSLGQPAITPLFDSRNAGESLARWSGQDVKAYDYIRKYWKENIYPKQTQFVSFDVFWDRVLHDGVYDLPAETVETTANPVDVAAAGRAIVNASKSEGLEVVFYESIGLGDGRYADNPWLQEMPDPISKVTWDNFAAVSKSFAEENNFNLALSREVEGVGTKTDLIKIKANGREITLPVVIQPGTPENTIAVALGYGRKAVGRIGETIGSNAYPLLDFSGNSYSNYITNASFEAVGDTYPIAQTQTHHSINDGQNERRIVKETTLDAYKKNPHAGNEDRKYVKKHLKSLYPGHDESYGNGHHWGMAIDLNSCIGCGACTVACTAENNVPVVGKKEVMRAREMHWLRIDRYYAGEEDNPSVIFQPMLCQHCDNAPCENVCPVAATTHNSEGINQMAYNRCIGTRYCANNCPYKVRRFNWFDYFDADSFNDGTVFANTEDPLGDPFGVATNANKHDMVEDLTRMVLNPDVTVRSRGVMEKCSFCVQRIQSGKLDAKKAGRPLNDNDIKTACQQACPTHAITFGDLNNEESEATKQSHDERGFKVIEQIHTLPSITYLTMVRNKSESEEA